nr:hypothetical protein [Tanacetum cinerariifolium]
FDGSKSAYLCCKKYREQEEARQQPKGQTTTFKRQNVGGQNVARAYTTGSNKKRGYARSLPYCNKCKLHHEGQCTIKCNNYKKVDYMARDYKAAVATQAPRAPVLNPRVVTCFRCGEQGHYKSDCPKMKSQNRGNKSGNAEARGRAIALLDVIPFPLDVSYVVKLVNGRVAETNIILRGCTLGLLGHPFDIDLMPIELGSFDIIVDMDWLSRYHAVIVCDEKVVRIPYENEVLEIQGDEYSRGNKSTLSIISCTKTQKYINKGYLVFLAHVTEKKAEDKLERKRLEDVPIVRDFRRLAQLKMQELSAQLQELSKKGFIKPSSSPSGALKRHPLLRINDLFDQLQGLSVYSKIELRSGYHQLGGREEDIPNTAFRTYYEFQVMPFGLTNAPASKEEHKENLKLIVEILKNEELYGKFSKFNFWLSNVQFIGHVIDSEVVHMDPAKIESIKDWVSPKTLTKIRQFLGLAGSYQRFIEGFSKIAKPITKLTQKSVKFDWGEKEEAAFQLFKEKVIAYASRQLKVHEKNYTTHDLELGAVVFTLKMWRHYMYGTKCVVFTDHKSLQYILDQKE